MMREAQSLKLKAESLQLDIQRLDRGRSLFGFIAFSFLL